MSIHSTSSRNSSLWIGLIVVAAGFFLLLDRLDLIYFPHWVISWPMFLIVIGLVIGIKKNFQSVGWLVLILLGVFFLLDEIPGLEYLRHYSLPIGIIVVGTFLVFRAVAFRSSSPDQQRKFAPTDTGNANTAAAGTSKVTEIFGGSEQTMAGGADDVVDLTTIFGGIKKKIFSKNFKGGQTTNFFGGTELDLSQADIQGEAVLDIVQAFGGVKLIVPSNWEVKSDLTSILGGIDDKRSTHSPSGTTKRLILTGTCVLGGVDIKNY